MEKQNFKFLSSNKNTEINAIRWIPDGDIKAIVQIAHGMVEFIDRYDDFANFLCSHQIMVVGHDHLGHGDSVRNQSEWGYFAKENGSECLIEDMHKLTMSTQEEYPDIPYFVFGHSMGSFITRYYLTEYSNDIDGAIICGTGQNPKLEVRAGKTLAKLMSVFKGWNYRSPLIDKMAFGGMNDGIENPRTSKDWLSRDEKQVDIYLAEPRCNFIFTLNGYYTLFDTILKGQNDKYITKMNMNLPLHLIAGDKDPVSKNGKDIITVYNEYKRIGVKNITYKLYEDYRHEILNEIDNIVVYEDTLKWILEQIN